MVICVLMIRAFRARQSCDQDSLTFQQVALLLQLLRAKRRRLLSPGEESIRAGQTGAGGREHRSSVPTISLVRKLCTIADLATSPKLGQGEVHYEKFRCPGSHREL